jgi:hypothetical protein
VRPLIPYLKCTKPNAKIAGLDISDFLRFPKKFVLHVKMAFRLTAVMAKFKK